MSKDILEHIRERWVYGRHYGIVSDDFEAAAKEIEYRRNDAAEAWDKCEVRRLENERLMGEMKDLFLKTRCVATANKLRSLLKLEAAE